MAAEGGPNIVYDGLVLSLDAANPKSYPGEGTAWYDKSGNGNNVSLVNGPVFSDNFIDKDGTNDQLVVAGGGDDVKNLNGFEKNIHWDANWTVEVLLKVDTMGHFKYLYGAYNGSPTTQRGAGIWISTGSGGYLVVSQHFNNAVTVGGVSKSDILNCQGKWILWTITSDDAYYYKFYMNGVLKGSSTYNWRDSANRVNLASTSNYMFGAANSTGMLDGKFASAKIYNRPLSASEVLQNYNATKGRFGL